jgi:hypothetical protein
MSQVIQTQYLYFPPLAQAGYLAKGAADYYVDGSYLSTDDLVPGDGVILDLTTGANYVQLPADATAANVKLLFGVVIAQIGDTTDYTTGLITYPAGSPLRLLTTGYIYVTLGGTVTKNQNVAYDPSTGKWVVSPVATGGNGTINLPSADMSGVLNDIIPIRLSGRIS